MPTGKGRSSRRSGTSTPVVTTIAFVALCVLGVWLLASTPVTPPKSTAKATAASSLASSVINLRNTISDGAAKTTSAFEDLRGDLQGDAAINGGSSEVSNDAQSGESAANEDSAKETVDQEGGGVKNQESLEGLHGKENEEEKEKEKQKEPETQMSEESIITQQKEIETIKQNAELSGKGDVVSEAAEKREDSSDNQKGGSEETKVQDPQISTQGSSEENKNLISDEDQQKRLEQHQQQEDERVQQKQPQNEISEANKESKKAWLTTQADQSVNQKERKEGADDHEVTSKGDQWQLCNVTAGADYIPCLDNEKALAKIRGRQHFEHRERHCPEDPPVCLVPLPLGYKKSIQWPQSRDKARRNIFCQL